MHPCCHRLAEHAQAVENLARRSVTVRAAYTSARRLVDQAWQNELICEDIKKKDVLVITVAYELNDEEGKQRARTKAQGREEFST